MAQPHSRMGATCPENLLELERGRNLQLIVATLACLLVRPPAEKRGRMPKAIALEVIVLHLADAFDADGLPGKILARAPPALPAWHTLSALCLRPGSPGMPRQGVLPQRLQLGRQRLPLFHRERR